MAFPSNTYELGRKSARQNWTFVRSAVNATRFWKRASACAFASEQGVDLGSLKQFIDKRKLVDVPWTHAQWLDEQRGREIEDAEQVEAQKAKREAELVSLEEARTTASSGFHGARTTTSSSFHGTRAATASTTRPQSVPQSPALAAKIGGERRKVFRVGKMLSDMRCASPRNQQLRKIIPGAGQNAAWEAAWARFLGIDSAAEQSKAFIVPTGRGGHLEESWQEAVRRSDKSCRNRPITAPPVAVPAFARSELEHQAFLAEELEARYGTSDFKHGGVSRWSHELRQSWTPATKKAMVDQLPKESGFTIMKSSGSSKPRAEIHPLLAAIEGMQQEEVFQSATPESGVLAQRLDDLRWGELRKGAWTSRPDRQKNIEKDIGPVKDNKGRGGGGMDAPGRQLVNAAIARTAVNAGIKDIHGASEEMQRLVVLLDPDRTGSVSPEAFVPLFFWLGLTRRRTAALTTLELAFGPGDIDVSNILKLARYIEVQIRLIEGLRQLARRESLEQLCDFIIDMARIRKWFQSMKRDTIGHVDIVEVQNLFARMQVTSDRQTLFRFLKHITGEFSAASMAGSVEIQRTFGIGDFASLLCRCATAWLLNRTLMLLSPSESVLKGVDGPLMMPAADLDREAEMRWVALQRKIIISLLVNHRFWGRESRTVLMSLTQPQMTTLGNMLSPEQWLSLFHRVRAQGIASTLPIGDEATDPEWLQKVVRQGGEGIPSLPQIR